MKTKKMIRRLMQELIGIRRQETQRADGATKDVIQVLLQGRKDQASPQPHADPKMQVCSQVVELLSALERVPALGPQVDQMRELVRRLMGEMLGLPPAT